MSGQLPTGQREVPDLWAEGLSFRQIAVAMFGMRLRRSSQGGDVPLAAAEEIAASALGKDPSGYRAEFVDLVRKAAQRSR